jgi:hypothetical protein
LLVIQRLYAFAGTCSWPRYKLEKVLRLFAKSEAGLATEVQAATLVFEQLALIKPANLIESQSGLPGEFGIEIRVWNFNRHDADSQAIRASLPYAIFCSNVAGHCLEKQVGILADDEDFMTILLPLFGNEKNPVVIRFLEPDWELIPVGRFI